MCASWIPASALWGRRNLSAMRLYEVKINGRYQEMRLHDEASFQNTQDVCAWAVRLYLVSRIVVNILFSYNKCYGLKVWGTFHAPTYGSYGQSLIFRVSIMQMDCSQKRLPFLYLAIRIYTSPTHTCRSMINPEQSCGGAPSGCGVAKASSWATEGR